MEKILMIIAILLGIGLGNFIVTPHTPLLSRVWAICSLLLYAGVLSYFSDILEKRKITEGLVTD